MRRFLSLFTMLMLCGVLAFAQGRVVTGKVYDNQGNAVPFATVTETGTRNSVTSDQNGNYNIRLRGNGGITISAVGYNVVTSSGLGEEASVILVRNNTELATVVVTTALGVQRQAKELGYSTARVKAAELTQAKVVNLQNGLTGKVSGLNVQTINNGVFADTRILLRGIRSLTGNNQPMLIVDGVPISLSFLSSINPNDIQNVDILKSSSSTAIYGPDGVNGAIVVTTKKGSRNKPIITLSHTTQLEKVTFMPKFQTQFGSGSAVDANGYGVYDPIENQTYGDEFDGSRRMIGREGVNGDTLYATYSAKPGEKKRFWNTGITNQTDLSYSTGDFYLSAQNVDIKGIQPGDENKRNSIHLGANREYNRFRAGFTLNYTQTNFDINAGDQFGNGRDFTPYWNLINTPINIPITQFKDWRNDYWSNPNQYFNDYYHNPYFMADLFRQKGRWDDIFGNVELNYKATSWLNLTYRLGTTVTNRISKATAEAFKYSAFAKAHKSNASADYNPQVIDRASWSSRLNSEIFATIRKDYEKFRFDVLLGQSFREIKTKSSSLSSNNLGVPGLYNVSVRRGELVGSENDGNQALERFFGKLAIGYHNWAFVEGTASYDIDSRLSNSYNFKMGAISSFYPGVSASIVLSEAIPGLKANKTLSFAKLRGAVSKTGNVNLGEFSLENTYSQATGFPYGTLLGFTANNTLRRDSYKPEFVINKEVGLELGFLSNRINFEGTYYHQDNTNQIITVAYSAATGYPSALLNAASFTNKGFELDLKLTPLIKFNKGTIDFKINYSHQENKVSSLIEGVNELGIGNGNFVIVGLPAYTFKLTDYLKDSLGRVIVDSKTGFPSIDPNPRVFGQTLPSDLVGLSMNVNWKGLTLAVVADYRTGNQIYSGIGPDMDFSGISYRTAQNARQPFIFPNSVYLQGGKYVENKDVYLIGGGYNFWSQSINTNVNSNYLASAAFWKLREVSLGYTFPENLFNKSKTIKGASFTITGRNLFTWLPSTNEWTDPEFSNTTGNAQGVNDRGNTPPTRLFGANLTLQF